MNLNGKGLAVLVDLQLGLGGDGQGLERLPRSIYCLLVHSRELQSAHILLVEDVEDEDKELLRFFAVAFGDCAP